MFEKYADFQNLRWTRNGKRVSIYAISRARGRDFSELSPTSTQPQTATERHGQTTTMTFEGREPQLRRSAALLLPNLCSPRSPPLSYLLSVWVAPLASLAALARRGKGHNEPIPQRRRLQASATQLRRQRRSRQLKRGPETTLGATCVPTTRSETTLEATLGTTCTQTTPPETTPEATWVTKAPPERSKNLRRGRKNGCPKMSQNGLPGGPKKGPKMSPLRGRTLDTCSRKKPFFKTCVGQGTGSAFQLLRSPERVGVTSPNFR